MSVNFLLTVFGFLTIASSQVTFPGKCNNLTVQQNFNTKKYLGTWYEIEKYPTIFQSGATCLKVNYARARNNSILVENSMTIYGYDISVYGTMGEIKPNLKEGKFSVQFSEVHNANNEIWILSTDYTSYSIVWHCNQQNNSNEQFAWVLSRTPNLTDSQRMNINTIIEKNHLDLDKFVQVNQTHCRVQRSSAMNKPISFGLIFAAIIVTYKLY